jgi:hypothetical protein
MNSGRMSTEREQAVTCPVVGRKRKKSGSPNALSLALANGSAIGPVVSPVSRGESVSITLVEEIVRRDFDDCPICSDPATTDEHVPPRSVGGGVITRTCGPCNHNLVTNVEVDLLDWLQDAIPSPRYRSTAVPGDRQSARILVRETPTGEFLLFLDGPHDNAVPKILDSGSLTITARPPDRNRYSLALLKHAYLAACMRFGVEEGDAPDRVRRDLIAARDAEGRENVPTSTLALGLTILRSAEPAPLPHAVWAIAHLADRQLHGVVLSGRVFVSWESLPPTEPYEPAKPIRLQLDVCGRIDGTLHPPTT